MRVVMANKYHFLKGGAERYVFELTKLLVKNGEAVVPFAMRHHRNEASTYEKYFVSEVETENPGFGWRGLRLAGRMLWSLEAEWKFARLLEDARPEILHAHNIYHQLSPSFLATAEAAKLPIVMSLHDYHLISPNYVLYQGGLISDLSRKHPYWDTFKRRLIRGSWPASALSAFEGWLHRKLKAYDSVATFIAPSRFSKDLHVAYGIPAAKIEVIPHFIDLTGRDVAAASEATVLFVGRLSEEKGAQVLLEAMRELPEIRAVIVGDGPDAERLKRYAKDEKLRNVVFKGALHGMELRREYDLARAVVVPSLTYETFGLVVLEAYAAGKPVIASHIGALPEVVREGETGLLCEPGDAQALASKITSLINDPDRARAMGLTGRALAESEYHPEKHLERILQIYRRAIGK